MGRCLASVHLHQPEPLGNWSGGSTSPVPKENSFHGGRLAPPPSLTDAVIEILSFNPNSQKTTLYLYFPDPTQDEPASYEAALIQLQSKSVCRVLSRKPCVCLANKYFSL